MKLLNTKRIELNKSVLNYFFCNVFKGNVSRLSKETTLPYSLIYNLANDRIKSISFEEYKKIFGKEPAEHELKRVDAEYFRDMVQLWLFLNDNVTKKELYVELYNKEKTSKKIDYRIFNGHVKTVEYRLERKMEQKYLEQGLKVSEIKEWIKEIKSISQSKRVSYKKVKPILTYLETNLNVHPTRLLKKSWLRYEKGELKTVAEEIYHRLLALKEKTEVALSSGEQFDTEKIREEVYGRREGFTPYYEVEQELDFLKTFAGASAKKYLGRSDGYYKRGKVINLATWRIKRIRDACLDTIKKMPGIPLASLPKIFLSKEIQKLTSLLKSHMIATICSAEGMEFEKRLLGLRDLEKKVSKINGDVLVRIDDVPRFLDMKRKAFDYLVASHTKMFKKISERRAMRWYIPDVYLKALLETEGFALIRDKYNLMVTNSKQCLFLSEGRGRIC
jgi:hypothetical protein